MESTQLTIEITKIAISAITPIAVVIIGLNVAKQLERNKLSALKEKEWQVRWSELFLKDGIEFSINCSKIVYSIAIFSKTEDKIRAQELNDEIHACYLRLLELDWNIQNFAQFSNKYKDELISKQQHLMNKLREYIENNSGNFEEARILQFEYNKALRNAHGDILNSR
jgi:hypothetical protein